MSELISIIVPVYNVAPYITDCVNSILSQSYRDIELILVDDGSTDHSGTICDKYAQQDSRVRVFHLKNGGVSAARNFGMKQAVGEYFMFVDSDDELTSGALHELTNHFAHDADVIIFGTKIVRNDSVKIILPQSGIFDEISFGSIYIDLYKKYIINSPVNKVYKRKIVLDGALFPLGMSLGEDLIFCNAYLRSCKRILMINKALYIYKQRESDSLTTKFHNNLFEMYQEHYWDVVKTMNHFNPQWEREECTELYGMYYRYVKQSINMTWHERNKATMMDRYQEIKRICRHEFTRECVAHTKCKSVYDILLRHRFAAGLFLYLAGAKMKAGVRKL